MNVIPPIFCHASIGKLAQDQQLKVPLLVMLENYPLVTRKQLVLGAILHKKKVKLFKCRLSTCSNSRLCLIHQKTCPIRKYIMATSFIIAINSQP